MCIPVLYVRVHHRHIYCATYLPTYLYKVFSKIQIRGKTHDGCFEVFHSWDKPYLELRLSQSKRQQLLASPRPQGCQCRVFVATCTDSLGRPVWRHLIALCPHSCRREAPIVVHRTEGSLWPCKERIKRFYCFYIHVCVCVGV